MLILALGKDWDVFPNGCDLSKYGISREAIHAVANIPQSVRFRAITKIISALGLEQLRKRSARADAVLIQSLSTIGRNQLIKSALQDVYPKMPNSQLGYAVRWLSLVLSLEIDPRAYTRDSWREFVLQKIESENPNFAVYWQFGDFLYDLHLQKQKAVDE